MTIVVKYFRPLAHLCIEVVNLWLDTWGERRRSSSSSLGILTWCPSHPLRLCHGWKTRLAVLRWQIRDVSQLYLQSRFLQHLCYTKYFEISLIPWPDTIIVIVFVKFELGSKKCAKDIREICHESSEYSINSLYEFQFLLYYGSYQT